MRLALTRPKPSCGWNLNAPCRAEFEARCKAEAEACIAEVQIEARAEAMVTRVT